jgi:hypothetical protein
VIPSVLRTVRTLLSWQVGFPCSSSIMNRKPVPDVMAKFFCVTARLLRVALTSSPICLAVIFKGLMLCYRTGILTVERDQIKRNIPDRELNPFLSIKCPNKLPLGNIA